MVIVHSYVSLPEGNPPKNTIFTNKNERCYGLKVREKLADIPGEIRELGDQQ